MLFFFALLSLLSYAQTESQLDIYIKQFEMEPQFEAPAKRVVLFELGKKLFHDERLSGKENISCSSCHSVEGFSADGLPLGLGEGAQGLGLLRHQSQGNILSRGTPALYNLGLPGISFMFWDGRVHEDFRGGWVTPEPKLKSVAPDFDSLLAVQAIFPLSNPDEMLGKESKLSHLEAWENVMTKIFSGEMEKEYKKLFQKAYPTRNSFNISHVGNALAEFERHEFLANRTPWDLYLKGKKDVFTPRMARGAVTFMVKANCIFCHTGPHLSSFGFQNVGVPQIGPGFKDGDDRGRFENTGKKFDLYTFKIAPLRNVALTAPYMHSGAFKTLWQVIDHYNQPMNSIEKFQWDPINQSFRENLNLNTDPNVLALKAKMISGGLKPLIGLNQEEKTDLYCFLAVALTDMKHQNDLRRLNLIDEIEDCAPVKP